MNDSELELGIKNRGIPDKKRAHRTGAEAKTDVQSSPMFLHFYFFTTKGGHIEKCGDSDIISRAVN